MARLESIEIKDLFDRKGFDHKIEFNEDPGMTIIVGANGFGKTTILKMINGLLSFDLSIFFSVPYTKVKFIFSQDIGLFDFVEFSSKKNDSGTISHFICFDKKKINIDPLNLSENLELANFLDDLQYRENVFGYSVQRRRIHYANRSTENSGAKYYFYDKAGNLVKNY